MSEQKNILIKYVSTKIVLLFSSNTNRKIIFLYNLRTSCDSFVYAYVKWNYKNFIFV